jgi:hypothetical protein
VSTHNSNNAKRSSGLLQTFGDGCGNFFPETGDGAVWSKNVWMLFQVRWECSCHLESDILCYLPAAFLLSLPPNF